MRAIHTVLIELALFLKSSSMVGSGYVYVEKYYVRRSAMKILLVDDSKTNQLIMQAFLKKLGHEVLTGDDGQQAIEIYNKDQPDLVLMDVIMPVMDGHEAARAIRQNNDDWVPIIFLSGKVSPKDIAMGIEAGGDDYLTKPVDYTILEAKLKAMQRISEMRHRLLDMSADLERANDELRHLANVDGLTKIANRRYMDDFLTTEIARAVRYKQPLSVILSDVDHFKLYNDHYGHLEGDDCLKKIAATLDGVCQRSTDVVARYGGEEFAIILPNTNAENGQAIAEQLRRAIEDLAIPHLGHTEFSICTLSLGVYTSIPKQDATIESLLQKADFALYQAKKGGRNRVGIAS